MLKNSAFWAVLPRHSDTPCKNTLVWLQSFFSHKITLRSFSVIYDHSQYFWIKFHFIDMSAKGMQFYCSSHNYAAIHYYCTIIPILEHFESYRSLLSPFSIFRSIAAELWVCSCCFVCFPPLVQASIWIFFAEYYLHKTIWVFYKFWQTSHYSNKKALGELFSFGLPYPLGWLHFFLNRWVFSCG